MRVLGGVHRRESPGTKSSNWFNVRIPWVLDIPDTALIGSNQETSSDKKFKVVEVDIDPSAPCIRAMGLRCRVLEEITLHSRLSLLRLLFPSLTIFCDPLFDSLTCRNSFRVLRLSSRRGRCELKFEADGRFPSGGAPQVDSIRVAAAWFGGESPRRYVFFSSVVHR